MTEIANSNAPEAPLARAISAISGSYLKNWLIYFATARLASPVPIAGEYPLEFPAFRHDVTALKTINRKCYIRQQIKNIKKVLLVYNTVSRKMVIALLCLVLNH